ncbi:hypothetical protein Lpp122_1141 [Lacticaseibacillus paracasei subsp. paracasei Lpp122]|uniref:Uncharacterized protein n=1 Tax=Lacticaseibacillus paracasei subsp. paracasei Lpp122 TaxID=1256218 RepID=A0A8E0I598_LACPA|nr:hypothetical protein Lpp230_1758 [Lacticaseibacillus paracasei subsp. paracasei Lpp230]EPC20008.1 hypothetical protein Lpp122_1141 [Lacticaseibacillus paracasei subsp. paracasei Lpp122]
MRILFAKCTTAPPTVPAVVCAAESYFIYKFLIAFSCSPLRKLYVT